MAKAKRSSKRRLNEFPEGEAHSERRNPKSIRKLIYDVIRYSFDGDVNAAAEVFDRVRRDHKGRGYKTDVTAEAYYRIVHDKQSARYMHLEAIAIYLNIPVGLLLLYSRITAEQNEIDDPRMRVTCMLQALAQIVQIAAEKVEKADSTGNIFEYHDLKIWIEIYKERRGPKRSA